MFENLKADLLRDCYITYQQPTLANKLLVIFKSMGFQAIAVYRFGRWCDKFFSDQRAIIFRYLFSLLHRIFSYLIVKMYGIDIHCKAVIGKGFYIGHFAGIKIQACEIGEFCSIHQHVKIGKISSDTQDNIPHIGDYVWIGPHAQISENITIGNHATLSAGSVVANNIAPRNLVVGSPARVIAKDYDNRPLLHQLSLGQ